MLEIKSRIVAIETAVVDYHYPAHSAHEEMKNAFITALPRLVAETGNESAVPMKEAPRKGDMIMVPAEILDELCVRFAITTQDFPHHLISTKGSAKEVGMHVRNILFGSPTLHAGGSVANTFDAMIHSKINGEALFDGTFVTTVGDDSAGQYFEKSFEGHIRAEKGGRQMVSHIIPMDGDRIMLTAPSFANTSDAYFDLENQLDENLLSEADIIMIGGYLYYAGQFQKAQDIVNAYTNNFALENYPDKGPIRVITLAAQGIADENPIGKLLDHSMSFSQTTIHGNTGEFRRAMETDKEWRTRFASAFIDADGKPLEGREAERAKNQNIDYVNAKQAANMRASEDAYSMSSQYAEIDGDSDVSFVVTNGAQAARVISKEGIIIRPYEGIERSMIKSTVGAGDNHVAGYWVGKRLGLSEGKSLDMAAQFARAVIQVPEARLDHAKTYQSRSGLVFEGPIAHLEPAFLDEIKFG